jgi:hypothetical protein
MTEPITLNLTLKELQQIDEYVEMNDDTLSVLMKIKDAYPKPKMHLENEGEFSQVSYDGRIYYRLQLPTSVFWYRKTMIDRTLGYVEDIKTRNELESLWLMNDVKYRNDDKPYCPDEPLEYDEVESDIDENKEKPNTLYSIIDRWWLDVFCGINEDWDRETSIEDLVDRIEFWNRGIEK